MPTPTRKRLSSARIFLVASVCVLPAIGGCSGEPSARELKNRQEFEALLTAISLKNPKELEADARRIEERQTLGELSNKGYNDLKAIIDKARSGDWAGAEKQAYEFRERRPYFK